ncbi:hypothetical protein QQ045_015826 [Rhodiola kirilowii]
MANQKLSLARDFDGKAQNTFKAIRRKESKEKVVSKFQRRKKRVELDRLKKSYLLELEKSKKSIQLPEADRQFEVEREGLDEEARKLLQRKETEAKEKGDIRYQRRKKLRGAGADQSPEEGRGLGLRPSVVMQKDEEEERRRLVRKEAEFSYHIASRLGIKGNLPEEEMIQIFVNLHNERR